MNSSAALRIDISRAATSACWFAYVQEHPHERFDLLLTDVVMPRMGGEQLAEQLRAIDPALKVLFISGYTGSAMIAQGRLASQTLVLTKPFEHLTLARRVREVLGT
jgi:CheY-like chemotaxis protein